VAFLEKCSRYYLISNSLFGFKRESLRLDAQSLRIIKDLQALHFGARPNQQFDKLLPKGSDNVYPDRKVDYEALQSLFKLHNTSEKPLLRSSSRMVLRRFLYFGLQSESVNDQDKYYTHFLNSEYLLDFESWKTGQTKKIETNKEVRRQLNYLKQTILEVILEEFTDFSYMLFKNQAQANKKLYITLKHRGNHFEQNAQLILAELDFSWFEIKLAQHRRSIHLVYAPIGRSISPSIFLDITLPMLDYIASKNKGTVAHRLDASYKNQIERFKSRLLQEAQKLQNHATDESPLNLLYLDQTGQLKKYDLTIYEDKLEVRYV